MPIPAPSTILRRCLGCAAATLLIVPLLTGCSPEKEVHAKTPDPVPNWNWAAFAPSAQMRLATLPCQLLAKSQIPMNSPVAGNFRAYVTQPQTNLPAGFIWGEFEPEIFDAERSSLEEARVKLEEKEKLALELEVPKKRLQLEREIEEAQRQVKMLHLLSTNPELANLTLNAGSGTLLRPDAVGKAETELGLLKQTFNYINSTNLLVMGLDLPGQRSEWERRKLDFDRRLAQSRMKMPFAGQLTLSIPFVEGVKEYPVNSGQELGVARDLSAVRLRVLMANPAWASLPAQSLYAIVRLPNGDAVQAEFAFQKIERQQQREESAFYFQFPAARTQNVARMLGSDISCEIWLRLERPARVVPKLTLLLERGAPFQNRTWAQGVGIAFPGSLLLIEGQTDLAILTQDDVGKK